MRTKARRLQLEHGIELLVVDYLQLANPGRRVESRVQEVSQVSQALKNLARELKIPVLALSQLSRAVEHRGDAKPQLADLRESGAIEQDADVVMFLYKADADATGSTIPVNALVAKHRNGPTGEVNLLFRGDRIRFYNMEKGSPVT
jgi:replicative DNA helicase